jgi:REP element-mobilizing transposase RayT
MRPNRDFRPHQLYAITQRGNQGQWVYRDDQDFTRALDLMRHYALRHDVQIHGWCLMHNHGHWVFEASTAASISNLMRDMQSKRPKMTA